MQIFVLDRNPIVAARYLCDKHCVKQILESCQMLCSPFDEAPYKKTHYNHPCNKWIRESKPNYEWLIEHCTELFKEYTLRYGKTHKSLSVLHWVKKEYNKLDLPDIGLTPFAQAMPSEYKRIDAVQAYRSYYIGEKSGFAKWKLGNIPEWFKNNEFINGTVAKRQTR